MEFCCFSVNINFSCLLGYKPWILVYTQQTHIEPLLQMCGTVLDIRNTQINSARLSVFQGLALKLGKEKGKIVKI